MKKIVIYTAVLGLAFSQTACDDFLKEDSGDLLIPKKVEEFAPVLYGEAYPSNFDKEVAWITLMTDDIEMGRLEKDPSKTPPVEEMESTYEDGRQAFIWHQNIAEKITDTYWDKRYANILGCNTIIDALPAMEYEPQEEGTYNFLAAQAYALRAYHYFCLINIYALPWTKGNLDELGVILRLHPQIATEPRERATIGEVYEQINEDIAKAREYAEKCEPSANKHLIGPAAIELLATRIALFQERWDEVLEIGTDFLKANSQLTDLNEVSEEKMGTTTITDYAFMNLAENKEILFTFGSYHRFYEYLSDPDGGIMWGLGFRVSYSGEGSLIRTYEDDDLRKKAWFCQDYVKEAEFFWEADEYFYGFHYPLKYRGTTMGNGYHENWRTAEVVLNVAEAYARKAEGVSQDAIDLLNKLRERRIRKSAYQPKMMADFTDKEDLVKFIWSERRRELCFEECMRFWDLRRQGMPELVHVYYTSYTEKETYVLRKGSPNYVLSLPASETKYNFLVTSNPREWIGEK